MAIIKFDSTTVPASPDNVNHNFEELEMGISNIYNDIYPIGISIMFHDNEDHSDFLGLTWERELVGLTPIGYNPDDEDFNEIGKTLGEKMHKLTVEEMPIHEHGDHMNAQALAPQGSVWPTNTSGINGVYTGAAGGDQPHNNIQPSKVVAFWKRIA